MTPANKAALAEIDEALNDPDTFDNHGDIVQKALEFYRSALTTPAANTGDDIQKPRCKTYCKFGNMDQSRPRLCMDCGHEEGEEAREQLTEILTKAHEKLALQRPEPSEGVKALLARLETGARSNSDAMQCYDSVRESTIEHPGASLPRDIFESFIDSIADDVAALAPRQVDEWQPIETAPRDKWLLLGYYNQLGKWRTVRGNWFSAEVIGDQWEDIESDPVDYEGWYETADNAEDIPNVWKISPTHWMPLPKPPSNLLAAAPQEVKGLAEALGRATKLCTTEAQKNEDYKIVLKAARLYQRNLIGKQG